MIGVGNYITTLKNQISSLQTTVNSGNSSPVSSSQTFTSSGTWVRPTGVDWVYVILVGGGGGGSSSYGNWNYGQTYQGSGGGSGSWIERWIQVTGNMNVIIGSGGGGGVVAYPPNSGGNGGSSSFGSLSVAGGGGANAQQQAGGYGQSSGVLANSNMNTNGYLFNISNPGHGGVTPYGYGNGGNGAGGTNGAHSSGSSGTSGLCVVLWRQ